jgi:hypothetical protein
MFTYGEVFAWTCENGIVLPARGGGGAGRSVFPHSERRRQVSQSGRGIDCVFAKPLCCV